MTETATVPSTAPRAATTDDAHRAAWGATDWAMVGLCLDVRDRSDRATSTAAVEPSIWKRSMSNDRDDL